MDLSPESATQAPLAPRHATLWRRVAILLLLLAAQSLVLWHQADLSAHVAGAPDDCAVCLASPGFHALPSTPPALALQAVPAPSPTLLVAPDADGRPLRLFEARAPPGPRLRA